MFAIVFGFLCIVIIIVFWVWFCFVFMFLIIAPYYNYRPVDKQKRLEGFWAKYCNMLESYNIEVELKKALPVEESNDDVGNVDEAKESQSDPVPPQQTNNE